MSKEPGNIPPQNAAVNQTKPQAASHMFWFFILPCLVFLFWASFKLVNEAFKPKPERDVFSRLEDIKKAKTSGDRWKAAYNVSQELQKIIRDKKLATMNPVKKEELYVQLDSFLKAHKEDVRLKRYLLLTLGQMGEVRALPSLEEGFTDKDSEVRFFSAWGYLEILGKNPPEITPQRLQKISVWLTDKDSSLQSIATTFLVQHENVVSYRSEIRKLLTHADRQLRWNSAVALASVKDPAAKTVLLEIFDLRKLREWNPPSTKDLEALLGAALGAALKLDDAQVLTAARALRSQVSPQNPEGRTVLRALATL